MPQERIEGKFYPLTAREIVELSSLLTDGEFKIYLYLMACNPFSDCSHPIDTAVIAENLGVTRRTAQRAIKKLDALGLIEIEISRFEYKRCEKATPGSPTSSETRSGQGFSLSKTYIDFFSIS